MEYIDFDDEQNSLIATTEKPIIDTDECLIKVAASGINRADLLQRAGKYPAPAGESPILGLEVAGVIEQVGKSVSDWQLGQRVCALVPGGGYAEYTKVKASHLIPLPDSFSFEQGAAIAEVFLTAYQSLFAIADLKQGESVLIHAGASGVGSAAIQLAKAVGAAVVTTVSNPSKGQACEKLGADHVINYRELDFVEWTKAHYAKGFDVVLDVVGGDYLTRNINVSALDGRIVMLAMLSGRYSDKLDIAKLLLKRINIHASTLRNRSDDYKTALVQDFCRDFYPMLVNKQITPIIDSCYSWQQVDQAHQRMASNQNIGKLILSSPSFKCAE